MQQDKSGESEESAVGCFVVFFVGLAIFCFFNPSCSCHKQKTETPSEKVIIQAIMSKDVELSNAYVHSFDNSGVITDEILDDLALAIQKYVQEAKQFARSQVVPADFAIAYNDHLYAWENFGNCIANHPYIGTWWGNVGEGFLRGLMGDISGGAFEKQAAFEAWAERIQNHNEKILTTWKEVENCALKHGIQLQ